MPCRAMTVIAAEAEEWPAQPAHVHPHTARQQNSATHVRCSAMNVVTAEADTCLAQTAHLHPSSKQKAAIAPIYGGAVLVHEASDTPCACICMLPSSRP